MTVRLMNDNFVDTELVSHLTKSSEQAAFPVLNVFNKQRRSKVWRSNGYWVITASNQTIVFQETNAVDLTALVATGTYTSTTSLLAAIKAALEVAGASTYTVSVDTSTLKIKIVSNGAGGGGILSIVWTSSTAMATLLGYDPLTNDTGSLTYLADVLRIHQDEWIQWDFGMSNNPKAFILIGARNDAIKISPSATLLLQGNETSNWTTPNTSITLTYGDSVISEFNTAGLFNEAMRYARLKITDLDNPLGYVEIGAIYLGDVYESTRGQVQFPFQGSFIDRSETSFSEGGQTFSDIREKSESFSINWFGLTYAEKEVIETLFNEFGTSIPFFISFDPMGNFSSQDNYYVRYVKFESEPNYELVSPNNFQLSMTLREEL